MNVIQTTPVKSIFGKRNGTHRAAVGRDGFQRTGKTPAEAREACATAIERAAEYVYTRHYTWRREAGQPVCFVLYYADGWCYDIVRPHGRASVPASCMLPGVAEYTDALAKMLEHANTNFEPWEG